MLRVECIRIGSVRLTLALMLGLLVVPGFVVAPVLFDEAGSLSLAGALAGEIFHIANLGLMLLSAAVIVFWLRMRSAGMQIGRLRWGFLALLVLLIVTNEYTISPILAELKVQIGSMDVVAAEHPLRKQFGMWHGVSATVHLIAAIAAAALVALGPTKPGAACSS